MKRTFRHSLVVAAAMAGVTGASNASIDLSDPIVASYASETHATKKQALRKLMLQDLASGLQSKLKSQHSEILGGVYIEHTPDFKVNVMLTKGGMEVISPLLKGKLNALRPYISVRPATWTYAEMEERLPSVISIVQETGETADFDIDVQNNVITINSVDPIKLAKAIQATGERLPEGVIILHVGSNTRQLAYVTGGLSIRECTSGFGLIDSNSRRGIATAAHCGNNAQYYPDYSSNILPYISGAYGFEWDIQWHSVPGYTPTNQIWNGSSYIYMGLHRIEWVT